MKLPSFNFLQVNQSENTKHKMACTIFKDELFELLLVSNRQDMRKIIFNARPDTKQTHYLLQLDTNNNILKILSNPNDHEM
jgi:hypothetical protein